MKKSEQSLFKFLLRWAVSAAGITVLFSIGLAVVATIDKGPYIVVNTVVTGGMFALMAMGVALVMGVMNIPNFAHGEYFMIGTLAAYFIITPLKGYLNEHPSAFLTLIAPLTAIAGATIAGGLAGAITDKMVFYQLRKRTKKEWVMNCFLITLGLGTVLINGHQLIFGTVYKGIVNYWEIAPLSILGVFVSVDRLFASILAILVIALFWIFLKSSRIGRAIRAVSQDEEGALMTGIPVNTIHTLTMALSCALAALAGGSLLFMFPSYPTVGLGPLFNSWFVIIVVGFGNVAGTIAGGFIIALLQVVTRIYVGEGWEYVIPMLAISAILVLKPSGLFGARVKGIWEK